MFEILSDIIRHTGGLSGVETIKVTGTPTGTTIQAMDEQKVVFINGKLKEPTPELQGEFGITNLGMLRKLLEFTSYRCDGAKFKVVHREIGGKNIPTELLFRDAQGTGTSFKLMNIEHVPEQATIMNIPWDISITPDKGRIAEFTQLAGVFAEVGKVFTAVTKNNDLIFMLGEETSSTHNATMVFEPKVTGDLKGDLIWETDRFLSMLKIAGNNPVTLKLTSRGVLGTTIESKLGVYDYCLRAAKR